MALTGDLVNIGLESEFVTAQRYIERVGGADFVSVIPGNHDVYVRSSFKYFAASAAPWMTGDGTAKVAFPYVRVRGGVALIGPDLGRAHRAAAGIRRMRRSAAPGAPPQRWRPQRRPATPAS